tara:strand:- start:18 stop:668 length:651 start_codon:yes stop_codon:yes gene_type:complete
MFDESIDSKEIYAGLVSITNKMQAEKDGKNPHFRSDYMTLDGILNTVKPILQEAGMAIVQSTVCSEDKIICTTRLIHESGQWLSNSCYVHADKNTPQGYGSAITYARRYAICSLLGIAEMDDDGNEAESASKKSSAAPAAKVNKPATSKKKDSSKLDKSSIEKVIKAFEMAGVGEELLEKKYGGSGLWTTTTRREMLEAFNQLSAGKINKEYFLDI